MESRISATGLKSVELDELTTNQIIINNEGLSSVTRYFYGTNLLFSMSSQRNRKSSLLFASNFLLLM